MARCKMCRRWRLFLKKGDLCRSCQVETGKKEVEQVAKDIANLPLAEIELSAKKVKPGSLSKIKNLKTTPLQRGKVCRDFVVIDTETTGLSPEENEIVELGAVRFVDGKPVALFSTLINPGIPIPKEASQINGITDEMVQEAPSISQVIRSFDKFIGTSAVVGHNLTFDLGFILVAGSSLLENRRNYFCTLAEARKLLKAPKRGVEMTTKHDVANHRLGTLCAYFGIEIPDQHRAYADAYCTGLLFLELTALKEGKQHLKQVP